MTKRFDPYHAWLGIPAEEQPPNHYRLLGVPLFESQPDVIQNGLNQRLAHIKSFAAGPHAADSQRLLTEVSQAGVCLLRPEKRQIYDKRLRSTLAAPALTPVSADQAVARPSPGRPAPQTVPLTAAVRPAAATGGQDWNIRGGQSASGGFPIVPTIVGSVIGLGVACLVLFTLSRGGTSPDSVAQIDPVGGIPENLVETPGGVGGVDAPEVAADPPDGNGVGVASEPPPELVPQPIPPEVVPEKTGDPAPPGTQPAATLPGPTPPPPEPAPTGAPVQPAESQPPASWPRALPGSPQAVPAPVQPQSSGPFSTGTVPSTPQGFAPSSVTPSTPSRTTLTGTSKPIVLDLERSVMYITLAEDVEAKNVRAQLQNITNLATPYDLHPDDGIVALKQPVDVVLTQYAGVKIHLSMHMKGKNTELKVTPEIETGPGKTSDFSKRTLDQSIRSMKKNAVTLNKQLAAAQSEAVAIQNWLAAPVAKTVPVRNARRQRLNALTTQAIPALQQQMGYLQTRADVLQQLSLLAGQIHEKASLDLVVQVGAEEKAE